MLGYKVIEKLKDNIEYHATEELIEKYWIKKKKRFDAVFSEMEKLMTAKISRFDSLVIEDSEHYEMIQGFFEKKTVLAYKLLYRGS